LSWPLAHGSHFLSSDPNGGGWAAYRSCSPRLFRFSLTHIFSIRRLYPTISKKQPRHRVHTPAPGAGNDPRPKRAPKVEGSALRAGVFPARLGRRLAAFAGGLRPDCVSGVNLKRTLAESFAMVDKRRVLLRVRCHLSRHPPVSPDPNSRPCPSESESECLEQSPPPKGGDCRRSEIRISSRFKSDLYVRLRPLRQRRDHRQRRHLLVQPVARLQK
jgi:hypothetical protein